MAVTQLATQTSQTTGQASNTMSINVSAAGTVKVAAMIHNGSVSLTSGVASIGDSLGNTYLKVNETNRAQNEWMADFQFDYPTAVGTVTLTITYGTSSGNLSFTKAALDDAGKTSGSADISAVNAGLSSAPTVTTSPTATTQATESAFASLAWGLGTGLTQWPPAGYTGIGSVQTNTTRNGSMAMAYLALSATGVQTATPAAEGSSQKWAFVLSTVEEGGGGTVHTQTLTAAVTSAGAYGPTLTKKGTLVGVVASVGASGPRAITSLLSASIVPAGATAKKTVRSLASAGLVAAGSLAKQAVMLFSGTVALSGSSPTRLVSRLLAASASPAGSVSRLTSRSLSAAVPAVGGIARQTRRALASAALASAGALSAAKAGGGQFFVSLVASVAPSGSVSRRTGRVLAAAVSAQGVLAKLSTRTLAATVATAATIGRGSLKTLTAVAAPAGGLTRTTRKSFSSSFSFVGSVGRLTRKAVAAVLSPAGLLAHRNTSAKNPTGGFTNNASISRFLNKVTFGRYDRDTATGPYSTDPDDDRFDRGGGNPS